jgi:precorrin-2/cobalt-factor-2 C20-methyltransferase
VRRLVVVGVGPGDPGLLTLRAKEVLQEAPVVFFPVKAFGEKGVALEIVKGLIPSSTELVEVVFPMVKDQQALEEAWKGGAERILNHPAPWSAFVTLGCPQVYSTYFYIHPYLKGVEVEIVPGVTSFSACSALTGEPLVLGSEAMAVLSASHLEDVPWENKCFCF